MTDRDSRDKNDKSETDGKRPALIEDDQRATTSKEVETYTDFDAMNLQENLLRGIYGYGFERPSVIQQKAVVPFAKGVDLIAQAQSGTGKTATYSIGMLQQIDYSKKTCQGLVLVPTRELALQVQRVVQSIGDYLGVISHACIGGTSVKRDIDTLSAGVHVIVGTPGRVYDMMSRNYLKTSDVRIVVLDEADEMLSRGFIDVIRDIFSILPTNSQVGVFFCYDASRNCRNY